MVDENSKTVKVLDYADKLVPIVASVLCGLLWLSGRLEDPSTKTRRIERYVLPLTKEVDRIRADLDKEERSLDNHRALGGHAVTESRLAWIEQRLSELEKRRDP